MDPKEVRESTIREAKIALICDAARKVFSEKGFFDARLEDIAAAAGFSKAALYSYYADKEEIFMSIAIRDLDNLYKKIQTCNDPERPFFDNLRVSLRIFLTFFGENFSMLLSVSNFQTTCHCHLEKLSNKHQDLFSELPNKFRQLVEFQAALIQKAIDKKEVAGTLGAHQLALYIGALIRGIIFQWQLTGKMGDADLEIDNLIGFLHAGMGFRK